ncbi:GDSL-type esterase/lipase family protein [Clostridium senegalense]|uniref:SGNH hydrolase-type esterase domain-containing protein n=1 Tax=Clostridium senegalense TaxID=1465809 RepID=A0A6M0H3Y6_9CLOT|nr:GDSL-type esterase/lipase family protein [Clostridium senegalense]NEU04332.1 hypothetical protein [Clostridium senegalense]
MNKKKKYVVVNEKRLIIAIIVCLIIIFGASIPMINYIKNVNKKNELVYGKKEEVKQLEDSKTNEEVKEKEEVKSDNKENKVENNKTSSDENILTTSAFMGDSITEGFSFYELVEDKRVLANKGDTTEVAVSYVNQLKDINPKNIFILYGMNDLICFSKNEDFISQYEKLIEDIKKEVPNSTIYVQSVFPVASFGEDATNGITNTRIEEVNKLIVNMCVRQRVNYIDISKLLKGNDDSFEPDGKHVKGTFYSTWIDEIKNNLR